MRSLLKRAPVITISLLFLLILIVTAVHPSSWMNPSTFFVTKEPTILLKDQRKVPERTTEVPRNCSIIGNLTSQSRPRNDSTTKFETDPSLNSTCPDYFRWIHEDLRPFKSSGISRDGVERAKRTAHFRVVIMKGKAYVEKYRKSIQTRDIFTLWGILQLSRRYPGKLPDLELMFDCDDRPVVLSQDYRGPNSKVPPPLLRYCGDTWTMDIVFPDWSFRGW